MFWSVFAALALPGLAAAFKPLFTPVVFVLLVTTLVRLDWRPIPAYFRRPLGPLLTIGLLLVVMPVLTAALMRLLPLPPGLEVALVLMMLAPPLMSAPAIAMLVGLEAPLALLVTMGALLLVPLTLPPLVLALLGLDLGVGLAELFARLGGLVGGAFLLAVVIKRVVGRARLAPIGHELDGVNVLILLVFAIAVMDGVTTQILHDPMRVLLFTVAAFLANGGMQALTAALAAACMRGRDRSPRSPSAW